MIENLSTDAAYDLFKKLHLARLGCIFDGKPYVVPVNYYWEHDSAYIHSRRGRKIDALRANPNICLQVDEISSSVTWRSALVTGKYEEVVDQEERNRLLAAIHDRFPLLTPVESSSAECAPDIIVFCVRVTTVSGMKEG